MMSQKPELTDLTICRAAFAAWVFVYHLDLHLHFSAWLGPAAGLVRHGYMGVDGFFILSGLVLMHTHQEFNAPNMDQVDARFRPAPPQAWLRFYGKRLARIYPVHLATLLILLALLALGSALGIAPQSPQRFGLGSFVENLFLVQGWGLDHFGAWNYPAWSVSTEWAGYLLFPLFALLLTYWDRGVSLQLAIVVFPVMGLIYYFAGETLNLAFAAGLWRLIPEFLAGMVMVRIASAAADYDVWRRVFIGGGAALILLGALTVDVATVLGLWMLLFGLYMQYDAQRPPAFGRRPALHFLGLLSYCFYMSFAIAELLTVQLFRHLGWQPTDEKALFALIMTGLTFILAILLRGFVEQPARRAANRWLAEDAPAQAPPPPATEKPQSLF
ncbi:acyltransferase 3 [Acidocella sp. MX-AZ02]|nr:acyltransferase 3 [Acidocella sp. MX-AZ02]